MKLEVTQELRIPFVVRADETECEARIVVEVPTEWSDAQKDEVMVNLRKRLGG